MTDTEIKVDTDLLREYASRLKKVNSRLKALEGDLEALYRREGLLDIGAILRSGNIRWNKTIDGAAQYLLDTADDFDRVEREIGALLDSSMQGELPFAFFDEGQPWAGGVQDETYGLNLYAGKALTPEQYEYLSQINDRLLEMLDARARRNIESGVDNLATIFSKLSYEQQEEINLLVRDFLDTLSREQRTDLRFLNSRELINVEFHYREEILRHLKENQGTITYDDLVRMGVCSEDMGDGGFLEELMKRIPGGNPADWPAILEQEYVFNQLNTSFAELDAEEQQRRAAENAATFMMAAAPLMSWGIDKFRNYSNKMSGNTGGSDPAVAAKGLANEQGGLAPSKAEDQGAAEGAGKPVQTIKNRYPGESQSGKEFGYTVKDGKILIDNSIHDVDFVVDMNNNLHIGRGHSFLAGGKDIQAAGTMKVNSQGYVRNITNASGHFAPTVAQAKLFPNVLNKLGIRTKNAWVELGDYHFTPSGYVDVTKSRIIVEKIR